MKLLAGALFLIVMFAVYDAIGGSFPGSGHILTRYGVVLGLSFIAILAHELGHAAAVVAFRGRIRSVVVFPFAYRWATGKVKLNWNSRGGEIGGYVAYDLDRINARSKHGWIALAGPLANGVLAGAMLILLSASGPRQSGNLLQNLATALATLSCGMAIVNLIPFAGSDGSAILRSLRGKRNQSASDRST